ncbi:MAG: DNA mismatch repair endonuclease MutL [Muribaculaceae bacterium]|nr:DNA mismatch repair endonuclease MutL [Muribaculaceae bacterium]
MTDIIRLLPDSVANQIAAGEVIQRPSSAIKELVENAVDAGATDVKIVVKDSGKTMIQVIDNGCGMSETDARMAFERHATSKIRSADDLFTLCTMGFRGEALPSICAISEVDIRTRRAEDSLGTHLIIAGSKVELQEPCVCDKGTVITVKKLFFNVPARRKFLKSDSWELTSIIHEFERMALVNNNVRMSLDTGKKVIDLRAGSFKQRIVDMWKQNLDSQILPINVDTALVKIEGFVSRPEFARRRNPLQFLIANGRNMRHAYFHKAILGCYESLIAPDTQPCYFIKFTVDPKTVDVNRSPTKDDIKFEYEQQIWPILQASIKAALGKFSAVPSIDFTSDAIPVRPLKAGELPKEPVIEGAKSYNPFKSEYDRKPSTSNWEALYENFKKGDGQSFGQLAASHAKSVSMYEHIPEPEDIHEQEESEIESTLFKKEEKGDVAPICMQYAGKYILTSSRNGLLIIDQHRAHVRILYEEYMRRVEKMEVVSQSVMFPESIQLDEVQRAALEEIEDDLKRLGFSLEYESEDTWLLTALPAMLKKGSGKDVVLRVLDSVTEDSANYGKDHKSNISIAGKVALMMARASAIHRGDKLSTTEMEHICAQLFALSDPALTPNGNRIFYLLAPTHLDSLFQ